LLRRINPVVTQVLAGLREKLAAFHSDIGWHSIDPPIRRILGEAAAMARSCSAVSDPT